MARKHEMHTVVLFFRRRRKMFGLPGSRGIHQLLPQKILSPSTVARWDISFSRARVSIGGGEITTKSTTTTAATAPCFTWRILVGMDCKRSFEQTPSY